MTRRAGRLLDVDNRGNPIVTGSPNVFTNNKRASRLTDVDNRGHIMVTGAPSVYINIRRASRLLEIDNRGQPLVTGSPNVFIGNNSGYKSLLFSSGPFDKPRPIQPSEIAGYNDNAANREKYRTPENDANGFGDNPEIGPTEPPDALPEVTFDSCDPEDTKGTTPNQRVLQKAQETVAEAKQGAWKEGGNNPNIMNLYRDVGHSWVESDSVHWCAAYVGSILKRGCSSYKQTLRAADYNTYGEEVNMNDPSSWKPGDVIVWKRSGGSGHVAIIESYDPATNKVTYIGGNQSNNVTRATRTADISKLQAVRRPT